ncbi:hypothetical protein ACMD2_27316, partial [Ananas comosus]
MLHFSPEKRARFYILRRCIAML